MLVRDRSCVNRTGAVNRRKPSSVTQSRRAKIERDSSPKYTEGKRTAVKNSVTRRNPRTSEHDEGDGVNTSRKKATSRVTDFMNGPLRCKNYFKLTYERAVANSVIEIRRILQILICTTTRRSYAGCVPVIVENRP